MFLFYRESARETVATGAPTRYSKGVVNQKLVLITLLIKLGIAAAVSSALSRSRVFKDLLFAEQRNLRQTFALLAFICVPLTLGVWVRVSVPNFLAADIAFETVIIVGVLLGAFPAMLAAVVLALPALLHGEYLTLPFNLLVAIIFGSYGLLVPEEDVWSFSPFVDLSIYRWVRRNLMRPRVDKQILLLMMVLGMQALHLWLAQLYPRRLFAVNSNVWLLRAAICLCAPVVVGIPLKIWNALRIERKLEEQERLLLEARLDALQRQINPHFIFNTLNSIASLIRFRPDQARELIVKLASILRVLLSDRDAFLPLREEMQFTDDYLAIEVVRFGAEKLRVTKEMAPETMDIPVPSMVLQPLIENSIKHGLEPRINGGAIILRSRLQGEKLVLEVEDDGVGIRPENDSTTPLSGLVRPGTRIGMRNVRERLRVLYGDDATIEIISHPGRGTRVVLTVPVVPAEMVAAAYRAELRNTNS
jgi:two-component system LytT family sensor kinase